MKFSPEQICAKRRREFWNNQTLLNGSETPTTIDEFSQKLETKRTKKNKKRYLLEEGTFHHIDNQANLKIKDYEERSIEKYLSELSPEADKTSLLQKATQNFK